MTDDTPAPTTPETDRSAGPPAERAPSSTGRPASPSGRPAQSSGRPASSADVRQRRPAYRGEELDPDRGPGLGCFWLQVAVLAFFIVIIPVGLNLDWPFELLAFLLFVVIGLLLITGQTLVFLLRLVAVDRRAAGRRRPLASPTKTVGEIEDETGVPDAQAGAAGPTAEAAAATPLEPLERPAGEPPAAEPAREAPAGPAAEPPDVVPPPPLAESPAAEPAREAPAGPAPGEDPAAVPDRAPREERNASR